MAARSIAEEYKGVQKRVLYAFPRVTSGRPPTGSEARPVPARKSPRSGDERDGIGDPSFMTPGEPGTVRTGAR